MGWDNYTYKKPEYPERKPGKYRCIILKAEIGTSKAGNRMIVTKGLGTSILPVRFLTVPEIVVIESD